MSTWSRVRIAIAIVSIAMAGSGCGGAPSGPVTSTATTVATTPSPPTPSPPATPGPTVSASGPSVSSPEPPGATLAVDGGDPVAGQLGSYTWAGGGSDSPWLAGAPIAAAPGEPLTVTIKDGAVIAEWTARRAPAGATNGSAAAGLGAGGPPATFTAPERGRWSVQVAVRFAGGLGSATYYWDLTVR